MTSETNWGPWFIKAHLELREKERAEAASPVQGAASSASGAQEAAPVAPAGAQEVYQWRLQREGSAWFDADKETAYARVDENYEARTLYTAPVPATAAEPVASACASTVQVKPWQERHGGWQIAGTTVQMELRDAEIADWRALSTARVDPQEAVGKFAIEVEKMLCAALGREWSASGISIESLIAALAAKPEAQESSLQRAIEVRAGKRIIAHNLQGMLTNCIAAATTEKRKEFCDALLAAIQYEVANAAERAQAAQPTGAVADYTPGRWFDARTLDEMQAFYLSRLPAIREAAQEHGYAIGLHGSQRRDFDLMAMQWRDDASDKDTLAHAIAVAACGITSDGAFQWERKPSGRFAVSLPICWTDDSNPDFDRPSVGHIDLSIIDFDTPAPEQEVAPTTDEVYLSVSYKGVTTAYYIFEAATKADLFGEAVAHFKDMLPSVGVAAPVEQEAAQVGAALTLENAPLGTKAPSLNGGHWTRVEQGWKWCTGSTFPRPGGDWNGRLIAPVAQEASQDDPIGDFQAEARHAKLDDFVRSGDQSHVVPPFAAPAGQHGAAIELLADFVKFHTSPAGMTPAVIEDGEAFAAQMADIDRRQADLIARAKAIITPVKPQSDYCPECDTVRPFHMPYCRVVARATATNTNQPENLGAANTNKGGEA